MVTVEDFPLPELTEEEPWDVQDAYTGEFRKMEPLKHIETNEIQRGDFILVVWPVKHKLRRNSTIGRLHKVEKGYRPEDFKPVLIMTIKYPGHTEFVGPIEKQMKDGFSFYRGVINEDGMVKFEQITKLTEKQQ